MWAQGSRGSGALDGGGYAELAKPSSYVKPMTYGAVAPGLFDAIVDNRVPPIPCRPSTSRRPRGKEPSMFGKLTWDAIPFNQPIPLITSLVVILALGGIAVWVTQIRPVALSLERIYHLDRPQAHRHHVHRAGAADAGPRLCRRDHDARQQAMAIGAGQGFLPPEHYNQIFSAHGTIMIFFVAMPFVIGFMNSSCRSNSGCVTSRFRR